RATPSRPASRANRPGRHKHAEAGSLVHDHAGSDSEREHDHMAGGVGTEADSSIDDDTWRTGPSSAGAQLVARLLEQHGVAALIWCDGAVPWANATALELI